MPASILIEVQLHSAVLWNCIPTFWKHTAENPNYLIKKVLLTLLHSALPSHLLVQARTFWDICDSGDEMFEKTKKYPAYSLQNTTCHTIVV